MFVFFFKQKTAYEMRISDWSSDVCSSDLRHRERFFLVVGHKDEGDAGLRLQALQLDLHFLAQLEVERRERLVEQQHPGLARQRAGERPALLLAAGELSRPAVGVAGELHQGEQPPAPPI